MLNKIIHWIIMPCDQATFEMEKQNVGKISTFQSLRLKFHLLLCKWCAVYYKKLKIIDKAMKTIVSPPHLKENEINDIEDFKRLIKKKFKE